MVATCSAAANMIAFGRWLSRRAGHSDEVAAEQRRDGWKLVQERDLHIDLLRQVIDRSRRRENAAMTGLELALLAMRLPAAEQAQLIVRIKEILREALQAHSSGSGGGQSSP